MKKKDILLIIALISAITASAYFAAVLKNMTLAFIFSLVAVMLIFTVISCKKKK